jgi:predicted MFS family arabinose efflux permease
MGIWTLVFGGTTPLGGLEAGTLSHYLGVRWAVTVGALVCALAACVVWWIVRQRPTTTPGSSPLDVRDNHD